MSRPDWSLLPSDERQRRHEDLLERVERLRRELEGKTITYQPPPGVELGGGPYAGFLLDGTPVPMVATLHGRPLRRLPRGKLLGEVDAIDWPWPTFAVSKRPFDWAEDEAGVPVPPRQLLGDRRRWSIPLHPAAPVVQT